jgi:Acetyltransferase (GNAT) domain
VWPRLAEGYDFYLSQQESGMAGFEFLYLTLYYRDTPVLIAPMFTAQFNMGLAMDDVGRRRLQKIQRIWRGLLVVKTLFCGSPISEKGIVGIHPDYRADSGLLETFDRALVELARYHRARMVVFKDFMDSDLEPLSPLRSMGWFRGDGLPAACLPVRFSSLDEYLAQLGYATRKDLRRKLRKAEQSGHLEIQAVSDINAFIDDAYRLYLNVHSASDMHFELLTKQLFLNFTRFMPANTVFFLYWTKDPSRHARKLVGLNFCLQFEDRLIDKYIGMDYSVSRDLNLYFVSFLYNVQWCLDNQKTNYMLSQGGYPVKIRLGAQLIPMRTMTKIVNPFMNWFANRFAQ